MTYVKIENSTDLVVEVSDLVIFKDSDGDGLKDWEEPLWKTDPRNPDSDGDGTSDGEEVSLDRDPAKPSPGDEIIKKIRSTDKLKDGTLTIDIIDKSSDIYEILKTGISDPEVLERLDNELINEIEKRASDNQIIYSEKDITITSLNNAESFEVYKKNLLNIYREYSTPQEKNEFEIISNALKNNDPSELEELDLFVDSYKKLINNLLLIPTPSDLSILHLDMINSYTRTMYSLDGMKQVLDDPLFGFIKFIQYQINISEILNTTAALVGEINNNPEINQP